MLTFCVFTPAAITAFRSPGNLVVMRDALALGAIGISAGSVGATVGVLVA